MLIQYITAFYTIALGICMVMTIHDQTAANQKESAVKSGIEIGKSWRKDGDNYYRDSETLDWEIESRSKCSDGSIFRERLVETYGKVYTIYKPCRSISSE